MVSYLSENCAHIISQIAHQPTTTVHLQFTYTIIVMSSAVKRSIGFTIGFRPGEGSSRVGGLLRDCTTD